jgi:pimeloyl-ACP methyl ester carboxylesterase
MHSHTLRRSLVALVATGLTLFVATGAAADSAAQDDRGQRSRPTIVLVHGAFADASSWTPMVDRLQNAGFPVIAPANPLRGPSSDSEYMARLLDTLSGPLVLVGHSYAGIVISNAAAMTGNAHNVKALVFVDAFILDVGETAVDQLTRPGVLLGPSTQLVRPCPGSGCQDVYVKPDDFHAVMAGDLSAHKAKLLAASQRPVAGASFTEKMEFAAWHTVPSFAIFGTADAALGTQNARFMAQRAHAQTTEVNGGSHLIMLSHPEAVVRVIEAAARER